MIELCCDIQRTIECGLTLKRVRDMIITYSQMDRTDKCSHHSSIIWPVWLNVLVFIYELSDCWFQSRCRNILAILVSYPKSSGKVVDYAKAFRYPLSPVPLSTLSHLAKL